MSENHPAIEFLSQSTIGTHHSGVPADAEGSHASQLWQSGRYAELRQLLLEDLQRADESGDLLGLYESCNDLACVFRVMGERDAARHFQHQAVVSFWKLNEHAGNLPPSLQSNLACSAIFDGQFGQADDWLWRSLLCELAIGNYQGAGSDWANLGLTALLQGDLPSAKERLWEAVRLHRQGVNLLELGFDLYHLAQIFEAEGNWVRAQNLFERSAEHFHKVEHKGQYQDALYRARLAAARVSVLNFDPSVN